MTAQIQTSTLTGFEATPVIVEADSSKSLPGIVIVGMGNKSVDEAKERIRSAITNSHLQMPRKRITINLAPADLPKQGSGYDLAMACAILALSGQIPSSSLKNIAVLGELGLDGRIRPLKGIIGHVQAAVKNNCSGIVVPAANLKQASLVKNIDIFPVRDLTELYKHLTGQLIIKPKRLPTATAERLFTYDFADITGQAHAKRALEIAATGHHNILLSGPPGGGKSMLAKALVSILPPPTDEEMITMTQLHSLVGRSTDEVMTRRPFRSPHHSASQIALVGGGTKPLPGEISLSHRGVLFLDEFPEFPRSVLESLRQPLEDGVVTVTRAAGSVTYPAETMLVAAQNPCPCGYLGDQLKECVCTMSHLLNYQKRVSGPLMDRIDLVVNVDRIDHSKLLANNRAETSRAIAHRVSAARQRQQLKFGEPVAHLSSPELKDKVQLDAAAKSLLDAASSRLGLSARAYMRTIKISQTIADLAKRDAISKETVAEALQFRHQPEKASV